MTGWERMTREGWSNKTRLTWRDLEKQGVPKTKAKAVLRDLSKDELWANDLYVAHVRRRTGPGWFDKSKEVFNAFGADIGEVAWISVKRHDKQPIFDWRHMQLLKNDIVGPEAEAMQLFPAESRLVDTANQYHLFAVLEGVTLPFGFAHRAVSDSKLAEAVHAKQRDF